MTYERLYSYDRRQAATKLLDLDWVEGLRKDFLLLLKNLPKVHDYKEAHNLREAFRIYRHNFDELFFTNFLNNDLKYHMTLEEGLAKWIDKNLRTPAWSFSIELSVPIGFSSEYRSEEVLFAEFQRNYPAWKTKLQRKAQVFWKEMKEVIEWYKTSQSKPGFDVKVPSLEKTVLDGFQLIMKGYEPDNDYNVEQLEVLKEGLHLYRERAGEVAPILLRKQIPIIVDFKATLDKGGTYNHDGTITFYASSISKSKGPKWVVHAMAHEMGHCLFRTYLSKEATDQWYKIIRGDYGDLDVAEVISKWPGDAWAYDFPRVMGEKDPILALQVEAATYDDGRENLQSKEDFQKLLDSGTRKLIVPKTPITGYANKNPEEAFCEAIGMLVAYGPRAVHERVRWWLGIVLPGDIKTARYLEHQPPRW